ncbi:MAG: signal peptide peptidase SppA [Candidatus Kryptoniota bacterium]
MKNSTKIFLVLVVIIGLFAIFLTIIFSRGGGARGGFDLTGPGDKVAIVRLEGTILSSDKIISYLKQVSENASVKAIVLRIDSPGGGVAASQEIYEEVKKISSSVKPVVVSMGSIAASGGYYVSCAATKIVANPGTITGSIGVIAMFPNYAGLMEKLGLGMNVIKSGKYKDSGSPFRAMTDADRKYFQNVVDDSYSQFLDAVATARKLSLDKLKAYADGRVFTGREALKLGLVDTLGSLQDAIKLAAKLGGIKGKPVVVEERKPTTLFDILFGDRFANLNLFEKDFLEQPVLQYKMIQ